jgi:protein MpaA
MTLKIQKQVVNFQRTVNRIKLRIFGVLPPDFLLIARRSRHKSQYLVRNIQYFLLVILLLTASACQQTSVPENEALPTTMSLPTEILSTFPPDTDTPRPTFTPSETSIPPTATPTLTPSDTPTPSITPIIIPSLEPTPVRPVLPERFSFGKSVQGRDLLARRIGDGGALLMLVGGMHGGAEGNTVRLIDEMIAYFETTPGAVLPGITILLIPNVNPDGYQLGQTAVGRFNANGVDLNRNWACDWTQAAYFRDQPVNPGVAPFSEPETLALGALINEVRPSAVLFYHSAANGAFAGDCDGDGSSAAMVAAFGAVTGYPYGQPFTDYVVTGTASNWVDSLGIPSADVELASDTLTEFERNLRGVITLQCWLIGANATGISACNQ